MQNQRTNFGDACLERPFYEFRVVGNALYAKPGKEFWGRLSGASHLLIPAERGCIDAKPEKSFWGRLSGASLLLIPAGGECIVCKTRERILGTLVWSVPFINSC